MINGVGSFGGFLGPDIFGYVRGRTDDFGLALTLAAGMLVLAGSLIIPIKPLKSKRAPGGVTSAAPALNMNNKLGRL